MKPCNNIPKKSYFLISLLFFFLLTGAISCKKGDVGPAGPAGVAGPAGPTGTTGSIGTANVIYSDWFTASPWIKDTVFDIFGFNYTQTASQITQQILDSGSVITVGKLAGYNTLIWPTGQVAPLPIIINYKFSPGGITYTDTWSALTSVGKLKIRFVDDQNYYGSISVTHQFRYIIIPGGVKSTSAPATSHKINGGVESDAAGIIKNGKIDFTTMSYEELCNYFNIPK